MNILEDTTSKKDLEEEHTRELQFEQAFKLFQQALKLQKQRDYIQAYKAYDQLFQIDAISNHYFEEVDYIRGVQNGLANSASDVLSTLSPNLKSLRYLIFRNRGFLFLDILKHDFVLDGVEDGNDSRDEKFKKMFYSMLDDFCVALLYNEADEKLLEVLYDLWIYLKELKLAMATMEYAVSSKIESDELSGLLPTDTGFENKLAKLKEKLAAGLSNEILSEALSTRFKFLEPMKRDIENQQTQQQKKNKVNVTLTLKDDSLLWESLVDTINDAVKNLQDEMKTEDVNRAKIRFTEPYFLTEEPVEIVSFETTTVVTEKPEIVQETQTSDGKIGESQGTGETSNTVEHEENEQKQAESQDSKQQNHRASKRLARVESVPDKPEIVVEKDHFTGMEYFISRLKEIDPSLDVIDVVLVYLKSADAPQYLNDLGCIINNWDTNFTAAFGSFNPGKSQVADDNVKLVQILNNFSSNIQRASSLDDVPDLPCLESDDLQILTLSKSDYITLKTTIFKHLLSHRETPLIIGYKWSQSLISKFNEWILQFQNCLMDSLGDLIEDAQIAVGVLEALVDQSISLESQIRRSINSKRFNKAVTNGLCLDLIKYNDKITKWLQFATTMLSSVAGSEKDLVVVKARLKWCRVLKLKSQTVAWGTNKSTQACLQDLLHFISTSEYVVNVKFPNYKNFPDLTLENVKSQLTVISVLAVFWRILFLNQTKGNSEAVILLEDILLDLDRGKSEAIQSIKAFMSTGNVDMKLSLWNILLQFYKLLGTTSKLVSGFMKSLEEFSAYFSGDEYAKLPDSTRFATLCNVLGFYNNNLGYIVQLLETLEWQLSESMNLTPLVSLLEVCLIFEVHEEACSITSLRKSIRESSPQSYEQFKNMLLKTVVVVLAILKKDHSQVALHSAIKIFHAQLGASGICDAANGIFLKASQEYLSKVAGADKDMCQLIKCRYHYNIGIDGFVPLDHRTQLKEELVEDDCEELAKFVLPLCFHSSTIKNVPKHDMKVIIEEMYEVIGDPDFESDEVLSRNKAMLEYFLDTTHLSPKFVRDSFHGLTKLEFNTVKAKFASSGIYYLQGLLIFSSYKLRKKNMQGRAVEIENAITLFRNDLICGGDRMESWFLMGQAYGYLVEDDLIWTSDKLTVAERKIGTANLQRKSLICYLMAINCTLDELIKHLIKPVVGSLMSLFAKELFGAVSGPMDMLALRAQSRPQFVKKPTGTSFSNVAENPSLPKEFCLKLIKQSFHLAIKFEDADWSDFYYLSKTQRKLKELAVDVLNTMSYSCAMISKTKQSDCILEPYYSMVVMCMKYVKAGELTPAEGFRYIQKVPIIQVESSEVHSKREFYDVVVSALKQIDAADKKNWQHRAKYRLARTLYDEYKDVEEATKIMSGFISLKSANKQLVLIWKPEAERPGKHFLYTYQYIRFYIELLKVGKDINSLITMIPKLRRSSSIMVNLYTAWEFLCSTICKMMRDSLGVGDSFVYTDHFINNLSYLAFSSNVKSMLESLEHKGVPAELVPHLCFLHGANDMRKSNNGYGPTSMIDDTLVTIFFKIYSYYYTNTNFISTFSSPGLKKKIAKKDIFPLTIDLLKICKKEIDSKFVDQNLGYNYALNELLNQREAKIKKEIIELDTSEEPEAISAQKQADPTAPNNSTATPVKLNESVANANTKGTQGPEPGWLTISDNVKRYLVEMGMFDPNGVKIHKKYDPRLNLHKNTKVKEPLSEVNERGKRPLTSQFNPINQEVIVIDSDDDSPVKERPAKRSK